jgi:hypothetical protein
VDFRAIDYGADVARILETDGAGRRLMPLAGSDESSAQGRDALRRLKARDLFPLANSPEGALAGLYLYFSCLDEAHSIAQELETADGSFWHGIMHRREPDAGNAGYWFRQVGKHPVFPALRDEAHRLRFDTGREWDPFEFIEFCEAARGRPGCEEERIAMQVQLAEWQLLFDHCAREKTR